jgi:hypothetical protein
MQVQEMQCKLCIANAENATQVQEMQCKLWNAENAMQIQKCNANVDNAMQMQKIQCKCRKLIYMIYIDLYATNAIFMQDKRFRI